jgi:hypothetical protein
MRFDVGIVAIATSVAAFAPAHTASRSHLFRSTSSLPATPITAAAAIPNPFKKLPWNAKREREREARRLKQESAILHRQLGITEDASYEEITAACDRLIAKAGDDMKAKIKIEVAKDKILQLRLNARLAGLSEVSKDARAQSTFEVDGADDAEPAVTKKVKEWNAPKWTQGLVVKPDAAHRKRQIQVWGVLSLLGTVFPPSIEKLQLFNGLIMIGQLIFRGMPKDEMGGGFAGFGRGQGGTHKKVAYLLGVSIWISTKIVIASLLPAAAQGQRWTPILKFCMENGVFAVSCMYLQPYKG